MFYFRRDRGSGRLSWSDLSLAAFNPQVDLHPLVVLLNNAVVLAKRMSLPAIGQKDALHVRMARELDSEHVEDFALEPIGGGPDGNRTWRHLAFGDLGLHPHPLVVRVRVENPHQVEGLFTLRVMHGRKIDAIIELL